MATVFPKRKYPSAELSVVERELIARVTGFLQEQGLSRELFRACLENAGYKVSKASLDRWVNSVASSGCALSTDKASGARPLLDEDEREIAAGWVLAQNDSNILVSLKSFADFCKTSFGVALSTQSAHNYLTSAGFTYKVASSKTRGYTIDVDTLALMMFNWAHERRRDGDLTKLLVSLDFTYTGHRTDRRSGFAPTGGAQPKSSNAFADFTNCIVTAVWSDGVNRTPAVLFTYNSRFRFDRVGRKQWVEDKEWLLHCMEHYEIDASRVVYMGKPQNESRVFMYEHTELVHRFFHIYPIMPSAIALSDNGNAVFPKGKSALEEMGFCKHVPYPAAVHQYLSPNDNRLHGTAKQSWRASGVDFTDDVSASLSLLNLLDVDLQTHGKTWFSRNILKLTKDSAKDLITGRSGKKNELDEQRRCAYRDFSTLNARSDLTVAPVEPPDVLDERKREMKQN